jgi:hypothetical protein
MPHQHPFTARNAPFPSQETANATAELKEMTAKYRGALGENQALQANVVDALVGVITGWLDRVSGYIHSHSNTCAPN